VPNAREAGIVAVMYHGSSRYFARASSRHFAWLEQSAAGGRHAYVSKASLEGAQME